MHQYRWQIILKQIFRCKTFENNSFLELKFNQFVYNEYEILFLES